MAEIMQHLHGYVPYEEYKEDISVVDSEGVDIHVELHKANMHPILLGGDQLTAARARGVRKCKVNDEGLIPVAEDWHTRLNFLGVS